MHPIQQDSPLPGDTFMYRNTHNASDYTLSHWGWF